VGTKLQGIDRASRPGAGSTTRRKPVTAVVVVDDAAIFAACARLRRELADWLPTLTDAQLATPSLCAGWTVREVAGHLIEALTGRLRTLLVRTVRCRFDLHRANAELARECAAQPLPALVAALREHADKQLKQPGVGAHGPLTDLLVHDGDMRIPLGLPMTPDPALVAEALDFLAPGAAGFTPRRRLAGLRLVATDLDRSWGTGAAVIGTGADLMMAACGRRAVLPHLTGPGAPVLAARI
jgi:uncharacterized protein (TIGR03083 family)